MNNALKLKREEHNHELIKTAFDTTAKAITSPIGMLMVGSLANQMLYNAGAWNPHDPQHTDAEDWQAGANVSDWIFFATMAVAACQAAGAAADVIPSISDVL